MGSIVGWVGWGISYVLIYQVLKKILKIENTSLLMGLLFLCTPLLALLLVSLSDALASAGVELINLGDVIIGTYIAIFNLMISALFLFIYALDRFMHRKTKTKRVPKK
jgi:hypothetical protein